MAWKPEFGREKIKFGSRALLRSALEALSYLLKEDLYVAGQMRDKFGLFAIELKGHILVAKQSPYGYVVSVDQRVLNRAIKTGKKILMYIDSSKYFYEFDPQEIKEKHDINYRGDSEMINFSIRTGVNYIAKLEKAREIERKNLGLSEEDQKLKEFCKENF